MKLLVLVLPVASALRLPTAHLRPAAAAVTVATPALPAFAYEWSANHVLAEGTSYGDVVAPGGNYALSAFLGLAITGGASPRAMPCTFFRLLTQAATANAL